jgi:hypothetical protein
MDAGEMVKRAKEGNNAYDLQMVKPRARLSADNAIGMD